MGIVFDAEQDWPSRRVALKVLRSVLVLPELALRLRREAEVLARLQHPGIARLYEAGSAVVDGFGDLTYFALERIEGAPIDQYAREQEMLPDERVELIIQVCEAVHHAHQRRIVHRDLKPSNILVGADGRARVLDFGIAHVMSDGSDPLSSIGTRTGAILGTLTFMSPEQARGEVRRLDGRSDVYALGALLYLLLTGRPPLDLIGLPLHLATRRICEEEPRSPRSSGAKIDRDLETIMSAALEKDPNQRYASASDLAADLERWRRREPIRARPPSWAYRVQKFAARNPTLTGSVAAIAMILVAATMISTLAFWNAESRFEQVVRLSDLEKLRVLEESAMSLWPAHPENANAYRDWLRRARLLSANLGAHREFLLGLRKAASSREIVTVTSEESAPRQEPRWRFDRTEDQWWHDTLTSLVERLSELTDPDPRVGLIADIERRLEVSVSIVALSIEEHKEDWEQAIASIADREACPQYEGLRLTPQIGLVPIGQDPDSGLWEFVDLQSGVRPIRDEDGSIVVTQEMGVILVLIPGGDFWMGAQAIDDKRPNFDPDARDPEQPVNQVSLDPFFLSKFEMTQGQWRRITGENPSYYPAGQRMRYPPHYTIDERHPVENVSRKEAVEALKRVALTLPTEAQWEYAARAGSDESFWTGMEASTLKGAANLADRTAQEGGASNLWKFELDHEDGRCVHAPVGSYRPNRWGLYDVAGNAAEWCLDLRGVYEKAPRTGDGYRDNVSQPRGVVRGGSFAGNAVRARSAYRLIQDQGARSDDVGLRPSRKIDGEVISGR
ncbi:MAG: bifunctional serine/threonine-protein kinase/formylglycine-generating enzyme family protein [Planctomycetota bacterium]